MPSGIYTAYSGALSNQSHLEVIASNVANVSTAGFRRDLTQFDTVLGATVPFSRAAVGHVDLTRGTHRLTGDPLNVAIDGDGFFVVRDPKGNELYTRRGDFRLDANGRLVLPDGNPVMGAGGSLSVQPGSLAEFLPDGTLLSNGASVGRLRVVRFDNPAVLAKAGASLLTAGETAGAEDVAKASLAPGFVEGSNVSLAAEMVSLIQAQRSFEASMKSLQINNELTERMIQSQQ
jgi:flagellar basal-body rod protein FlgF